jgi:DNA-binding GntR family transcriptional regulator
MTGGSWKAPVSGAPVLDIAGRLDRDVPTALHEQISNALRDEIRSGAWPTHFRLPAEPDLAVSLGVSRGTLRKALDTLLEEGILTRVRGRGTFVASADIEQPIGQELLSLSEGLERAGIPFETRVLNQRLAPAPDPVAGLLGVAPAQEVLFIRRVRAIDNTPVAYIVNYVRTERCPGIEQWDFAVHTLFGTLEREFGLQIAVGRRTFEAQAALGDAAELLQIPVGAPVLYLEQVVYLADGTPIEYSDVWIRGDRLRLTSLLSRPRSA